MTAEAEFEIGFDTAPGVFDQGSVCWFSVFLDRRLHPTLKPWLVESKIGAQSSILSATLPRFIPRSARLNVWVYAVRAVRGDKHADHEPEAKRKQQQGVRQRLQVYANRDPLPDGEVALQLYTQRIGTTQCRIMDTSKGVDVPVVDSDGEPCGRVRLRLVRLARDVVRFFHFKIVPPIQKPSHEQWSEILNEVHRTHFGGGSNITEKTRRLFDTIMLPCGQVPMWSYAINAATTPRNVGYSDVRRLIRHLARVCVRQQIVPDGWSSPLATAELLAQIELMPARFALYVLDSCQTRGGGFRATDEWTFVVDQPVPRLAAFDCEDGTASALRMHSMIRHMETAGSKKLAQLKALTQRYLFLFCLGTLRLPHDKGYIYHAYGLKLDRGYVLRQLGLDVPKDHEPAPSVCIMESTNFTVACPDYTDPRFKTNPVAAALGLGGGLGSESELYFRSHARVPVEATARISASLVHDQRPLVHTQTAFCPELMHSHKIGQIEFGYQGKLGAPTELLIQQDTRVQFVGVRVPVRLQTQVYEQWQAMPLNRAPEAPAEDNKVPIADGARPLIDAWYRKHEWKHVPGTQKVFADAKVCEVDIVRGVQVVHVIVPE